MDSKLAGPLIGAGATLLAACIWVWGDKLTGDDKKSTPGTNPPAVASASMTSEERRRLEEERRQVDVERQRLADERRRLAEEKARHELADERRLLELEKARLAEAKRLAAEGTSEAKRAKEEAEKRDTPANFSGSWVTESGERFAMVQAGSRVQFRGTDELGASVAGEGVVTGRKVVITYVRVDETSRSTGKAILELSADGKEASGTYTNATFGERGAMLLTRQ